MQSRTAWQLRGRTGTYLLMHRHDLWAGEVTADPARTLAELHTALSDPASRPFLEDLARAMSAHSGQAWHDSSIGGRYEQFREGVEAAFRRGDLAVLYGPPMGYGGAYGGATARQGGDGTAGAAGEAAAAAAAVAEAVAGAAAGSAAGTAAQAPAPPKTWIEIQLVDKQNRPVRSQPFRLKLPDGSVRTGTLDDNGFALVDGLDPGGPCQVTFPAMDGREWKPR